MESGFWHGAGERLGEVMPYATLENPETIHVGKGTRIRNGAYITGPAFIGPNCDIGPNCMIRPCSVLLGKNHIGNGAEVKNSIIMEETDVPHPNYVGDSVIGSHCNIGGGTMVGNLRLRAEPFGFRPGRRGHRHGPTQVGGDHGRPGQSRHELLDRSRTIIGEDSFIGAGSSSMAHSLQGGNVY